MKKLTKIFALTLALAVCAALIPADITKAAGTGSDGLKAYQVNDDGSETEITPPDDILTDAELARKFAGSDITGAGPGVTGKSAKTLNDFDPGSAVIVEPDEDYSGHTSKPLRAKSKVGARSEDTVTLSKPDSNGYITLKGTLTNGDTFYGIYVDDLSSPVKYLGSTSMNVSIDMKSFSVGYHDVYVVTTNDYYVYFDSVPTYIYGKPSNGKSLYTVYSKYWYYYSSSNYYSYDDDCSLYMDYKLSSAKSWKTAGPMDTYTSYKKSGLKPARKYKTRTFYGKKITYMGTDYFFTGKQTNKTSGTLTLKTGIKKVPLKSLTVKASNIRKHKVRYYWYGRYLYTVTYYTYKLKATVTLKKKPKSKGLCFGYYKLKGNKKTYRKNLGYFSTYSKPRKVKYRVSLYTYQDNTYGGYSPTKIKTVRGK